MSQLLDVDLSEKIESLEVELARLQRERRSVANANVMAAELMAQLEEAGDNLRQANENLIEQHAQKLALHSAIHSALIALDNNKQITEWNTPATKLFGHTTEHMLGREFSSSEIEWCGESVLRALESCRRTGKSVKLDDVPFLGSNGDHRSLELVFARVNDSKGAAVGILVLGEDITEEKNLSAQLAHSQKLESIGQLSAGIAHEINTPIQYVGDNLDFLKTSFEDLVAVVDCLETEMKSDQMPEECKANIRPALVNADWNFLADEVPLAISQAIDGVRRVSTIVRAMKEFAHPAQGSKVVVDLNKQIETTAIVASSEWKYVAELETVLDPGACAVPCFPDEFNQVILNMIVNAAHAIADVSKDGEMGHIRIETSSDEDCVMVRISDNGGGIPQENVDRIFDPFFTTKEVGKGTGQGLSIAHNVIVNKHGGRIQVDSQIGTGTTFTIHLPIAETDEAA